MRARGRVNAMVWREGWDGGVGGVGGLELVTAHGDGSVGVWRTPQNEEEDQPGRQRNGDERAEHTGSEHAGPSAGGTGTGAGKKRKRQDFSALVEGLSKIRRPE